MLKFDEREGSNYQYAVAEIDESVTRVSRDQLLKILWAEGVLARRYFYPGCHRMEPYRSFFPHARLLLPETEKLVKRVLVLPTGTAVAIEEIKAICQIIRLAILQSEEVGRRLGAI